MAKKSEPKWRIIHIKGTPAETIGYVHAPDAAAAIERAIERSQTRKSSSVFVAERITVQSSDSGRRVAWARGIQDRAGDSEGQLAAVRSSGY